jgi:hypothetical protein
MLPKTPRQKWATGADLVRSFKFRAGMQMDKIAILSSVWEKELGHMSKQWTLAGVRRGVVFVKPRSSAAAQELHMRASEMARNLNKHFGRPWIKAVKTSLK